MEIQHINVKIFAAPGATIDLEKVNLIFHEWIQKDQGDGELLLDVADYAHVPEGPGMMLIGHDSNYSLDFVLGGRAGLLYNRKTALSGENTDRLRDALRRALKACDRLEAHQHTQGALKFNRREILVLVNDRALAPNEADVFQRLKPDFDAVFGEVFADSHRLEFVEGDSRERFAVRVSANREPAPG